MTPWNAFSDWWRGISFIGPSGDSQSLMKRVAENGYAPGGQTTTYPILTDQNWQFRCLANTSNGQAGEAYVAVAPDGTEYTLDYLTGTRADTIVEFDYSTGGPHPVRIFTYRMLARMNVSRVTDRFGNWVEYQYTGDKLTRIIASDGREVVITWRTDKPFIDHIVAQPTGNAPRTWQYQYDAAWNLSAVVLPDASRWSYAGNLGPFGPHTGPTDMNQCGAGRTGANGTQQTSASVTTPSGLTGTFIFQGIWHGRSYVPSACLDDPGLGQREGNPPLFGTYSLVQRTLSGPGVSPLTWNYAYSAAIGSTVNDVCAQAGNCAETAYVDVTDPSGTRTRQTFSTRWGVGEGQVLQMQWTNSANQIVKTQTHTYAASNAGPYPTRLGATFDMAGMTNVDRIERLSPLRSRTITQDGTSFYLYNYSFDAFANPVTVGRWSSLGYSKTEVTEYHHDLTNWVLNQPYRTYNASNGVILSRTEYTAKAQPSQQFAFEKLQSTLTYNTDGTLATAKDGRNNTTSFSNWKRGIPQSISFADGSTKSAVVDDNGWVRSITDENGYVTGYGYDAMGNVAAINYPQETNLNYHITTRIFEQVQSVEYGLAAGHWRERIETGNAKKVTFYDALFRPVAIQSEDTANSAGTFSWTMKRYDANGNVIATSYPKNPYESGWNTIYDNLPGTRTQYDALDRPTRNEQDSELGVLATVTEYLTGFQVRTTNPRGYQTTNGYEVYDAPSYDALAWSAQPENKTVEMGRNFAGLPMWIRQRAQDNSVSVTRSYVYDANMQLCKTIEPETGATVNHYDAAGNLDWSASGLALPDTANCNLPEAQSSNRVVTRTYDTRNRLSTLGFADGYGNQAWQYTPDGLPAQITTQNEPSSQGTVVNKYTYNHRRLLSGESIESPNAPILSAGYGFDGYGVMTAQSYPDSMVVIFTVNALGQVTGVAKSGTPLASNALYYPNGAIKQFTYGNGIVHTMLQNARQIPSRSTDAGVMNLAMSYDVNGNTTAIADDQQGSNFNRSMTYDGLDRLTDAGSPSFGGDGWHRIRYNALDNITSNQLAGVKDYASYIYDPSNRLTQIKNTAQQDLVTLAYDPQGNLTQKNSQGFVFDLGNRLRSAVSKETYRYDGLGRRVENGSVAIGNIYSMYSRDGQLLHTIDHRRGERLSYIYLSGSQIARSRDPLSAPVAPTLTAPSSSVGGHFALTWTASISADSYVLEQSTNGGAWTLLYSGIATNAATGAMSPGTYGYRVKACNSVGCSAYSAVQTVEVIAPPISAPTLTVPANGYGGSYTVSWSTVSGAARYELEENLNAGTWTNIVNSSATSVTRNSLPAGTYGYRVRACNVAGCSNFSSTALVEVLYAPSSAPVLTVPGTVSTTSLSISWSAVATADRYEVLSSFNGGTSTLVYNGAGTSASFSGLSAGTYSYQVRACNAAGCGPYSPAGNTVVQLAPQTPVITGEGSQDTSTRPYPITWFVSWTSVPNATLYEVERTNGSVTALLYSGTATSATYNGMGSAINSFRVRACNGANCSAWSAWFTPPVTGE